MNDNVLFHILNVIRNKGTLNELLKMGYQYSQIAQFMFDIIEEDYISTVDGVLKLTETGTKLYLELLENRHYCLLDIPEAQKITPFNNHDIYLPQRKTLKQLNTKPGQMS